MEGDDTAKEIVRMIMESEGEGSETSPSKVEDIFVVLEKRFVERVPQDPTTWEFIQRKIRSVTGLHETTGSAKQCRIYGSLMQPHELSWRLLKKMSKIKGELEKTKIVNCALKQLQRDLRTEQTRINHHPVQVETLISQMHLNDTERIFEKRQKPDSPSAKTSRKELS
jgi:hypothetical protein